MNKSFNIPDEQSRQKSIDDLRKVQQQLDLFGLEIEELLAMANIQISRQRHSRLEKFINRTS